MPREFGSRRVLCGQKKNPFAGAGTPAKRLACLALSLPPNWEYSVSGLAKICGYGRDMVRAALKELALLRWLFPHKNVMPWEVYERSPDYRDLVLALASDECEQRRNMARR